MLLLQSSGQRPWLGCAYTSVAVLSLRPPPVTGMCDTGSVAIVRGSDVEDGSLRWRIQPPYTPGRLVALLHDRARAARRGGLLHRLPWPSSRDVTS